MWTEASDWNINQIVMMLAGKYEVDPNEAEQHLHYGIDITILDEGGLSGAVLATHPQEHRFVMLMRRTVKKYNILELKSVVLSERDH